MLHEGRQWLKMGQSVWEGLAQWLSRKVTCWQPWQPELNLHAKEENQLL